MLFIILNLSFSILFMFLSHPLSLGLTLIIQTSIISMMTGKMCFNFWFSYILFLIMIGGMLILFIYMTSIASNEKFSFSANLSFLMLMIISLLTTSSLLYMDLDPMINNDMINFNKNLLNISMIKYTYVPMNIVLTFMIIYLFITLIAVVKIVNTKFGPLRSKN
uniref:NADH-ubiquinone oxidoreductase chain 6 n=1 Tax=Epicauta obscurocephala TaxID=2895755 RepID=A0A9Y1LVC3_9CUCU|nr:NADH dehydrogenase subunit 6 [Epicauta obscurocephala]WET56777.1 NADH dehydrogenase subunit 6 [Epicauta obscurocephala]